jgi:hypothetical protein
MPDARMPFAARFHQRRQGNLSTLSEPVELAQPAEDVPRRASHAMTRPFLHGLTARFAAPSGAPARENWPASGASDAHLALINALPGVLKPMTAADVFVRSCDAINDLPMKNGLRLGLAELAAITALSPGKGVHRNHDTYTAEGGLPIGRLFAASLDSSQQWPANLPEPYMGARMNTVVQDFYIVATDEGADLVRLIDSAAISEVSVSFMHDAIICSICNTDLSECAHWPLEVYDGQVCEGLVRGVTEYLETSLVWQGMANDTRIKMAAMVSGDTDLKKILANKPRGIGHLLYRPKPLSEYLYRTQ